MLTNCSDLDIVLPHQATVFGFRIPWVRYCFEACCILKESNTGRILVSVFIAVEANALGYVDRSPMH